MTGKVWFIGAGPGDPELVTLKARRVLASADVVLYAGSLVNPAVLDGVRPDAVVRDTARMPLDEQLDMMVGAAREGRSVARLHTGDPSVYGALHEQAAALRAAGVALEVVPGVSSVFAAAAALGLEFTLPQLTQTLILTRVGGRTPVPERERLRDLAAHRTSLALFLSTGLIREIVAELAAAGYEPDTPVAVVYRASWPDQLVIRATLETVAGRVEGEELTHQGLVIVSPGLDGGPAARSHLYGAFQAAPRTRAGTAVVALTAPAAALGRTIAAGLPGATLHLPARLAEPRDDGQGTVRPFRASVRDVLREAFAASESLVCVMAAGIVVRELGPLLTSKHVDPGVVVVDAAGRFAVSLVGGHEGGANALAEAVATITGGQAVVTTASDVAGVAPLDLVARGADWALHPRSRLDAVTAAAVDGGPVAVVAEDGCAIPAAFEGAVWERHDSWRQAAASGARSLVLVMLREPDPEAWDAFEQAVVYHPRRLVVGVGCNRGTSAEEIGSAIRETLHRAGLAFAAVGRLASIDAKADEEGLLTAARNHGWSLAFVTAEQIRGLGDLPHPSPHARRALGVDGVAEPTALLAASADRLLVDKHRSGNVTVAVAAGRGALE
ncbi:MAG: precorrin-4 C(11)-methyltransferase [Candidatus Limnocylindrales bacterium]